MKIDKNKNIAGSTYKGLLTFTFILLTIFVFKTLLFSYEVYSYDEIDKEFENNKLFSDNTVEHNNNLKKTEELIALKDTSNTQIMDQKNIIKDLTVNQKIVNINESLKDELIKLPGIGPKTADKIIEYREENGDFLTKEDLKKVKGIGPSKYKKIENLIKIK